MTRRISLTLIAFLLVLILPWWGSILFLFFLAFLFPWYYEAIILVLVYELLYGTGYFGLTITITILIPLIEELKKRLYVFS